MKIELKASPDRLDVGVGTEAPKLRPQQDRGTCMGALEL